MDMTDKHILNLKGRSFFLYILAAMLILVIVVIGLVTLNDYNNTKTMFEKNSQHLKQQTEQDIIITIRLTDEATPI